MGRFCLFHPCFLLALSLAGILSLVGPPERPLQVLETDRPAEIRGWIARPPELLARSLHFRLRPLSVRQRQKPVTYPGDISVYVYSTQSDPARFFTPALRYGEIVQFEATPQEPPYYAIPGVPDYRDYSWQEGILHQIRLKSPLQLRRDGRLHGNPLFRALFRYGSAFESFCWKALDSNQFKLTLSSFLGRKALFEEYDRNLIRHLGIFHLFVVSGFHVSLVVLVLHWLLGRRGLAGRLITVGGLWSYVVLVGLYAPVLRAALMTTLFYVLMCFGFRGQLLNGVGLSAILILGLSPSSLFSPGFQFSFLCLCAIGLFVTPLGSRIRSLGRGMEECFSERVISSADAEARWRRRVRFFLEEKLQFWPRRSCRLLLRAAGKGTIYLLGIACCSWFVQLLTLPLTLRYYNLWVWTQLLSNLIFIPLFALFLPLCLLLFATFWIPLAGTASALAVKSMATFLSGAMSALQPLTGVAYLPHPSGLEVAVYFALFLGLYFFPGAACRRIARPLAFATPLIFLIVLRLPLPCDSSELQITMLDVGQGESIHLRYPDGSEALVDTGGFFSTSGTPSQFVGERLVSRYLWSQRSRELKYVLLTHAHVDHIQGYEFIRTAFPVRRVFFYEFRELYRGPPGQQLKAGDRFTLAGVEHQVLHPPENGGGDLAGNVNNTSLVMRVEYGNFSILLTGDIDSAVERQLLPELAPVTVLKVAHHGSHSSSCEEFLTRVRAQLALISAGRRNMFGHPSPATLRRLERAGTVPLVTTEWGTLRIVTDGEQWRLLHYSIPDGTFQEILWANESRESREFHSRDSRDSLAHLISPPTAQKD